MSSLTLQRFLLACITLLITPFTFIWSQGDYYQDFGFNAVTDGISYSLGDPITTSSVIVYLLVLFAFLSKRNKGLRSLLIVISFLVEVWMIQYFAYVLLIESKFTLSKTLTYVFIRTDELFPWQIMNSVALAMISTLFVQELTWVSMLTRNFLDKFRNISIGFKRVSDPTLGPERAALIATVILLVFDIMVIRSAFNDFGEGRKAFNSDFHAELVLAGLALIIGTLAILTILFVIGTYLIRTYDLWRAELTNLNRNLTDFRLSQYVTRSIAGYLYWLYSVIVVGSIALITPIQTIAIYEEAASSFDKGFHPELVAVIIGIPLAFIVLCYLIILLLRLVFEILIATIHIAQNTTPKTQLSKP